MQDNKSKVQKDIDINLLYISSFNPRKTRPQEDIENLAERIKNNGYEQTRALWVYEDNGKFAIFAGGTRFKASKIAALKEVPCLVHQGFSDEEIVKLSDQDNENDEYHKPVSMVDMWMSYKALADLKWTQMQIAKAKNTTQAQVTKRVNYAKMPILDIIQTSSLTESHVAELYRLFKSNNLTPWVTNRDVMIQIVEKVTRKANFTAKDFKIEVKNWNNVVTIVEVAFQDIDQKRILDLLTKKQAYTKYEVQKVIDDLTIAIAKEKRAEENRILAEANKAEAARIKAEKAAAEAWHRKEIESLTVGQWFKLGKHYLYCGDTSKKEFYEVLPQTNFAFADPPYNADSAQWDNAFCWHHDWLTQKASMVAVTPGIVSIFEFAKITNMPYRWSMSCWIKNGMTRGALGFGNWIYIALFSNNKSIYKNGQDFLTATINTSETKETDHKGRKPGEAMDKLITTFSEIGEWVIDPFAGSGSTLLSCERQNRRCITGEIKPEFCKEIIRRWEKMTNQKAVINAHPLQ